MPCRVAVKVKGNKIDKSLACVKQLYYYPLLQIGKQRPLSPGEMCSGWCSQPLLPQVQPLRSRWPSLQSASDLLLPLGSPTSALPLPRASQSQSLHPATSSKAPGAVTGVTSLFLLSLFYSPPPDLSLPLSEQNSSEARESAGVFLLPCLCAKLGLWAAQAV